jgi:hypothetical protein
VAVGVGGGTLVEVGAGLVWLGGHVDDGGIGNGLALGVDDGAKDRGAVGAEYDVDASVRVDGDAEIGDVAAIESDGFCKVVAKIVGFSGDRQIVGSASNVFQNEGAVGSDGRNS